MKVEQISCSCCGASQIEPDGNGFYKCSYCGSTLIIETDKFGNLKNCKINGNMIEDYNVYAVHGALLVSGNMNDVAIIKKHEKAFHVDILKINGNMNKATVVLLDGAYCKNNGNMNKVHRI